MNNEQITTLSNAIAAALASEPAISIQVDGNTRTEINRVLVGFWCDTAVGREYICAHGNTFGEAYATAIVRRADKIAQSEVEAEVRAEIAARLARAA